MSESDSFIEEVTEEVRRDRLFAFFRKYAWAFAGVVVLIVGGAATNEYLKSKQQAAAQAAGEAFRAATAASDAGAMESLANADAPYAVLAKLDRAAMLESAGDHAGAVTTLDSLATDQAAPDIYKQLALLKLVIIDGANMDRDELFAILDRLAAPGAPFRLLAMEQRAIANIRLGDKEAANSDLVQILVDQNATQGLRNRVQQLTIALGG